MAEGVDQIAYNNITHPQPQCRCEVCPLHKNPPLPRLKVHCTTCMHVSQGTVQITKSRYVAIRDASTRKALLCVSWANFRLGAPE